MAFEAQAGSFAMPTSGGNSQVVTGLGFDPKIVFFFPTRQTADGIAVHETLCFGAAVSSTERFSASVTSEDGQSMSDSIGEMLTTRCFRTYTYGTTTVVYDADFVSMDTGAFTINVTTAPASAFRVGYLALGGTDLTDVALGSFQGDNATGNQDITDAGFQPDCVILVGTNEDDALDTNENHSNFMVGWATGESAERGVWSQSGRNNVTSVEKRAQVTNAIINALTRDGAITGVAELTSFLSNGFRLNWSNALDEFYFYIALKGGSYFAGELTTQTSTGEFSETGVGFQGSAAMFMSFCNAASGSVIANAEGTFGVATSSTEQFTHGFQAEDGQSTTDVDQFSDDALIYQNYDQNQTLEGSIDFASFDTDGITLDQIDADPSGNEMLYLVMGDAAAAGLSINVSDGLVVGEADTVDNPTDEVSETEGLTLGEADTVAHELDEAISELDALTIGEADTVDPLVLSIEQSDGLTVGDTATVAHELDEEISEADGLTVGDTATVVRVDVVDRTISESDGLIVGETVTASVSQHNISASDSVTLGDSATLAKAGLHRSKSGRNYLFFDERVWWKLPVAAVASLSVSESDGITLGESVAVENPTLQISESDGLTIGDVAAVDAVAPHNISEVESLTIGDTVTVEITIEISESDGLTIGDTATLDPVFPHNISVSDGITVGDSAIVIVPIEGELNVTVSDNLTVGESVTVGPVSDPQIVETDGLTIGEVVDLELISFVFETETITVGEFVDLELISFVNVSDGITVGEFVKMQLVSFISESDGITLGEAVTVTNTTLFADVSDGLTIGEIVTLDNPLLAVSESDGLTLGETVSVDPFAIGLLVSDALTVGEIVSLDPVFPHNINVVDALTLGDTVTISFGFIGDGVITLTLPSRSATLTLLERSTALTLRKRSRTLTLKDR